ncbi:hypothetical protein BX666DRAFT_2004549 [Dichotomocladium elegans]|nr:hypothetical protein BX666DRAFT_2004549 [Dichotomocladium elegans]
MGYATLDAALAFPNNLPPANSHILITDTLKSNANFLIHHFCGNHLKADRPVILVGLSQIFNHYFLIGRKLGINLQTFKQAGKLLFIDGLTHLNPYAAANPYPPKNTPAAPTTSLDTTATGANPLEFYYRIICDQVKTAAAISPSQGHPLLILDDASALLMCGYGTADVAQLIHQLRVLMARENGTLLTVVHADEVGVEDAEQDSFNRLVMSYADLVLQVSPLHSGLARDVHGELSILYGPQHIPGSLPGTTVQSMHYRILDNNVEFFAKGISKGVL